MLSVVSLGDLVADLVFHILQLPVEHEHHQHASAVSVEAGGMGIFLILGARLGMRMQSLGVLGSDAFGETVLTTLREEGVDVSGIVRTPGSTTTPVLVLVDQAGQHVFIGGKQAGELVTLSEPWKAAINQADALFVSGFTLIEPQMAQALLPALEYARQKQLAILFDPGPFSAELPFALKQRVLQLATLISLTEAEIPLLVAGAPAGVDLLSDFMAQPNNVTCIKRGGKGCRIIQGQQTIEHPGFAIEVRDTTGAGDTFAAGLLYGWLQEWPLEQIARFANAVGAAATQKVGSGRNVPSREEVWKVLEEAPVNISA